MATSPRKTARPLPAQFLIDYTKLANIVESTGDKKPRSGTSVPLRQFMNGIRRSVSDWLPQLQCGSYGAGVKSRRSHPCRTILLA